MVGSLITGAFGMMGAQAAADAATHAADQQREANQLARQDLSPWRSAGRAALDEADQLLGLGKLTTGADGFDTVDQTNRDAYREAAMNRFHTDPGYEFQLAEGQKGIDRSLAARGGALSGAAVKAGVRFNQDTAQGAYSNYFNRLMGVANPGAGAAGQSAAVGVQGAGMVGNDLIRAGQARQSGYNALGTGIGKSVNNGIAMIASAFGG